MAEFIEPYIGEEVAYTLNLHPYIIRHLGRENKIPAFKFGGQWRFNKEEIQKWMNKRLYNGRKWRNS